MRFDAHNHYLKDAIDEIIYKFEECKECEDNTLHIIHGYKYGTKIRDYIRSSGFITEMAKKGNKIIDKNFSQEGKTVFKIKLPSRSSKKIPRLNSSASEKKDSMSLSVEICSKCNITMTLLKDFNWYKCPKCGKLRTV